MAAPSVPPAVISAATIVGYGGVAPWDSEWDPAREESRHRMPQEVAAVIRELSD
jgi:hypothetical protein